MPHERVTLPVLAACVITQAVGAFGATGSTLAKATAPKAPLLVVIGGDHGRDGTEEGRRRFEGSTDLYRLLDDLPFDVLPIRKRLANPPSPDQLSQYGCILNFITDPDLNPRSLANLQKLLRRYRGKVVNRPEAVLRTSREQVAASLSGTPGLRVPRVLRLPGGKPAATARVLDRARPSFPLILRRAGTHTGHIIGLIDDPDALQAAVAKAGDYIATEFVDYCGADGLYRKYRVFFFGDRLVFRHMIVFDEWSVHGRSRMKFMAERPELLREEAKLCAEPEGPFPPSWNEVFREVRSRMAPDFFGLDFGVDRSGQMVLFEANATMNFFPPVVDPRFDYLKLPLPAGKDAFRSMVRS